MAMGHHFRVLLQIILFCSFFNVESVTLSVPLWIEVSIRVWCEGNEMTSLSLPWSSLAISLSCSDPMQQQVKQKVGKKFRVREMTVCAWIELQIDVVSSCFSLWMWCWFLCVIASHPPHLSHLTVVVHTTASTQSDANELPDQSGCPARTERTSRQNGTNNHYPRPDAHCTLAAVLFRCTACLGVTYPFLRHH